MIRLFKGGTVKAPVSNDDPFSATLLTGLIWLVLLWGGERLVGPEHSLQIQVSSGFFLLMVVVLPVALGAGVFLRVVLGRRNPYLVLLQQLGLGWRRLVSKDAEAGFRWLNGLLWWGLYLGAAVLSSISLCRTIATDVVRPAYQAILSVSATGAAFLALVPIPVFGLALGERTAPWAARIPGLRLLYGRRLWPFLLLIGGGLSGALLFYLKYRVAVAASPWQVPAFVAGSLLLAGMVALLMSRLLAFRAFSLTAGLLLVTFSVASAIAAGSLKSDDRRARRAFSEAPVTAIAYSIVEGLFDRDGDGFISAFAGGDCAPDDASISPVALDIPGNGIDEDCTGGDLDFAALAKGKWDYPLSKDYPERQLPIILITVDALAANHLHLYGYERKTTPHLDKLSRKCVVFDKAFSQGPSTRLSMAAMLTGLYDTQIQRAAGHKVPHPLDEENELLPEVLKRNEYDTVFVSPTDYMHKRWVGILQGFGTVRKEAAKRSEKGAVHNAREITKLAVAEVKKKRARPLFLWVHYWDAHPPFAQPKKAPVFGSSRMDRYDASVAWWDSQIQPLFDAVDKQFPDGYILIVTADHGSAFDKEHKRHSHGYDLHSSVIHVPLLVCSEFFPPHRVEETPVTLLDLFPTLVNLLGIDTDIAFEGTSLTPLLFESLEWPQRVLFHQFYLSEKISQKLDPLYAVAVRDRRYNYIWNRKANDFALYDWVEDPSESNDLTEDKPDLVVLFDGLLKNWLSRVYRLPDLKEGEAEGEDSGDSPGSGEEP